VELARAQSDNGGVFPTDAVASVPSGGERIVDGDEPSTGPTVLSLETLDGGHVAGAVLSVDGECFVAVFTVAEDPLWAADADPADGQCRAAHPEVAAGFPSWVAGGDNQVDLT
jgi:hypothetical protein